jgi:hypothetical protein
LHLPFFFLPEEISRAYLSIPLLLLPSSCRGLSANALATPASQVSTTRERMSRFYASWRQQLAAIDFAVLDQEGKTDYLLLGNHLTREEHNLALATTQWKEVEPLLPVASAILLWKIADTTPRVFRAKRPPVS